MRLIRLVSLINMPYPFHINKYIWEITGTEVLLSCIPVILNQDQGQIDQYQNVEFISIDHQTI